MNDEQIIDFQNKKQDSSKFFSIMTFNSLIFNLINLFISQQED